MERRKLQDMKKICMFVFIANLPFLTVAHLIGIEVFIESFQHPDAYQCIKTYGANNDTLSKGYLLLETPIHEHFSIRNGDIILYKTGGGAVRCEPVFNVACRQGTMIYYTTTPTQGVITGPIYGTQILGKVTNTINDNLWNALCIQLWDFSTKNLNAITYYSEI
jgi:hypothetical protein